MRAISQTPSTVIRITGAKSGGAGSRTRVPKRFQSSFYRYSPLFKTEVSSNGQDPIHGRQFNLAWKTTDKVFFGQSSKMALRPQPWTCHGGRGASIRQPVRGYCSQSQILPGVLGGLRATSTCHTIFHRPVETVSPPMKFHSDQRPPTDITEVMSEKILYLF